MGRRYHNGIKTFGLFMVLWVVLLAVGGLVALLWRVPRSRDDDRGDGAEV